jgi:hypothetical protein
VTEEKHDPRGAVSVLGLLRSIQERENSKVPKMDARVREFEAMKMSSMFTGNLYEAQVQTLKRGAMLIGGGPVVLTLNIEEKQAFVQMMPGNAEPLPNPQQKLEELVSMALGPGWCVTIGDGNDSSKPTKDGSSVKPPRKRGPKKGQGIRRKRKT